MAKQQTRTGKSNLDDDIQEGLDDAGSARAAAPDLNSEWGAAPDDWEEETTGFPPYWNPGEGKSFRAQILLVDSRDPAFVRFVCVNKGKSALLCARGPADDAEPVEVPVGGQFTISHYDGLPLAFLLGQEAIFLAKEKVKTNTPGRTVWIWKMKCESKVKALLNERRVLAAQRMAELQQKAAASDLPVTPSTNAPVAASA